MAGEAFDYIRQVNRLSEELTRSHGELLARKNIRRKQELVRVIKLDLDKLTHALLEVKNRSAESVFQDFFGQAGKNQSGIRERLTDQYIYHVGFEIHEPLGLVLHGIHHWIDHSRRTLGASMQVKDLLRFPASSAFQDRVGAYAEILRIWIEADDRVLMLELFDIERSADSNLASAPKATHRNFHGLFREYGSHPGHEERVAQLFAADEIWHYAFHVKQPVDVVELHTALQRLSAYDSRFLLPYSAPVHNPYDDSFHTKIVRPYCADGGRRELEFVTLYSSGVAPRD